MSPDSIPQISLGTAALVIFAVCAGFVLLRGMTRMMIGTVVLALSAWIGFRIWQLAPGLSIEHFGRSIGLVTTGLPIAGFLVSFFLIRFITKSIFRPFGGPSTGENGGGSVIRMAVRLLLALIPTTLICLIGATAIHHTGSIAEIRAFSEEKIGINEATPAKFSHRLKTSVEAVLPESWLKFLDPLADPSRLALAKAITAQSDSPLAPVIDPRTGQPIPRAIIVNDPELHTLAREGKFGTLLRHPLLTKALNDPKVQAVLKDLQL
ncbi:MAG: hypothetical protein EHM17_15420 [Verrucomicrobiaceae bacterium]|nr:MAG: hypothetical protein EHM17_15420 [Verrucomicrobiaceae bacterium]